MKNLLGDERLFYTRPGTSVPRRLGIILAALLLTAGTVLLIPLSDALRKKPTDKLDLQTVGTVAWRPPPPPPPRRLMKPPPPAKPRKPAAAKRKPKLPTRPQRPQQKTTRLPLRLDFQTPRFEADFALSFTVDPTVTEIPEIAESPSPPPPTPAPPPEKSTYESNEVDEDPVPTSRPQPIYPRYAKNRGTEGHVDLQFTVNRQGKVQDAVVINAEPGQVFGSSTLRAIRRWTFKPGIRDGKPVATRLEIRILFKLDR